jgi:DnaK suppressor protein
VTHAELTAFRDTLLRIRAELLAAGDVEVRAELDTPVPSARDEDEAPLVEMTQSIASARNRERAERLAKVDEVLALIASEPENVGRCVECDEPIPARRLQLLPFATQCVPCQSASEVNPHGPGRRKITDYR